MSKTKNLALLVGVTLVLTACTGAAANGTEERPPTEGVEATTTVARVEATTPPPTVTTTTSPATPHSAAPEVHEVSGVVIDVQGNLQGTDSFTILVEDGSELVLIPMPGLLFGGGPLSHLRDHVLSGAKVKVVYTVEDDGTHIAIEVGDA